MNCINLTGRLTRDPEAIVTTSSGAKYSRFTIAVGRFGAKEGAQSADFIPCIAWNKTAEILTQYCKKGQMIGVNGRLNATQYEKDGQKRTAFDVVALSLEMLEKAKTESKPEPAPEAKPEPLALDLIEDDNGIDLPFEL